MRFVFRFLCILTAPSLTEVGCSPKVIIFFEEWQVAVVATISGIFWTGTVVYETFRKLCHVSTCCVLSRASLREEGFSYIRQPSSCHECLASKAKL